MDLYSIASPVVSTVLPPMAIELRISAGDETLPNGHRVPLYESPGEFTGSIASNVLTVTAVASGVLKAGQTVLGLGVASGTRIVTQLTGTPGGIGTYSVVPSQDLDEGDLTTILIASGFVQPTSFRDLQQLDMLNVQGIRWKMYLYGEVNAVVRPERKGGDLAVVPPGPHAGTWLIAQVLEQWPTWCSVAITLQNGG